MKDEKLSYDIVDETSSTYELNEDVESKEEDQEKREKRRKRVIATLVGIGIIIALLLLGFGIKKNKVAAVLSDDVQNEMIGDLSGYINQIAADYISEDESKEIASKVIEDNFQDLLVQNFMSLSEEEITNMIEESLYTYMQDYYTSTETDTQIQNAVDEITNKFMADLDEIRKSINDVKTSVENLTEDYNEYKEITNKTLEDMSEKEQADVNRLEEKIEERTKELQDRIDVINSEISIRDVETPLISYVWNTQVMKSDDVISNTYDSKDDSEKKSTDDKGTNVWEKWNNPEASVNWHVTEKEHDKSNMTIKEFVEILAKNDVEFTKSINKLYEYINDTMTQEKEDREAADLKENEDREAADLKEREAREAADTTITNFFNTKVAELQEEVDEINKKLGGHSIWTGTQAEYNALGTKDANTLYFVTE